MEPAFTPATVGPPQCDLQTVLSDGGLKVSSALEGKGSLSAVWVSLSILIDNLSISNLSLLINNL